MITLIYGKTDKPLTVLHHELPYLNPIAKYTPSMNLNQSWNVLLRIKLNKHTKYIVQVQ